MSIELYLAFFLACVVLAVTPGPNMSLYIANGTAHGVRAALMTVLGASLGLSLLVALATIGMTSAMTLMAEWFDLIRWAGAAYLAWLGIGRLRAAFAGEASEIAGAPRRGRHFWQGLAVALSHPKVLLFLGGFFPQFIDPAAPVVPQLALMAITFVLAGAGRQRTRLRGWLGPRLVQCPPAARGGCDQWRHAARRRALACGDAAHVVSARGISLDRSSCPAPPSTPAASIR